MSNPTVNEATNETMVFAERPSIVCRGHWGQGGVGEDDRPKPRLDAASGRMEKKTKEVVNQIMSSFVFSHNLKLEKIGALSLN